MPYIDPRRSHLYIKLDVVKSNDADLPNVLMISVNLVVAILKTTTECHTVFFPERADHAFLCYCGGTQGALEAAVDVLDGNNWAITFDVVSASGCVSLFFFLFFFFPLFLFFLFSSPCVAED